MGVIKREDILGAWIEPGGTELVCADCLKDHEVSEVLTQDQVDESEDFYFCDHCAKRIK